jgi:hypothetical protein
MGRQTDREMDIKICFLIEKRRRKENLFESNRAKY